MSELKSKTSEFYGISGEAPSGDLIPSIKIANSPSELVGEFGAGKLVYDPYRKSLKRLEVGGLTDSVEIIPLTIEFFFQESYQEDRKSRTFVTTQEVHDAGFVTHFERKSNPDKPWVDQCAKILSLINFTKLLGEDAKTQVVNPVLDGETVYGPAYIYANKRNFEIAKTMYGYIKAKGIQPWQMTFELKTEKINMKTKRGDKPYFIYVISNYVDTKCDVGNLIESISSPEDKEVTDVGNDNIPF